MKVAIGDISRLDAVFIRCGAAPNLAGILEVIEEQCDAVIGGCNCDPIEGDLGAAGHPAIRRGACATQSGLGGAQLGCSATNLLPGCGSRQAHQVCQGGVVRALA